LNNISLNKIKNYIKHEELRLSYSYFHDVDVRDYDHDRDHDHDHDDCGRDRVYDHLNFLYYDYDFSDFYYVNDCVHDRGYGRDGHDHDDLD
jgi:hypothetical protein